MAQLGAVQLLFILPIFISFSMTITMITKGCFDYSFELPESFTIEKKNHSKEKILLVNLSYYDDKAKLYYRLSEIMKMYPDYNISLTIKESYFFELTDKMKLLLPLQLRTRLTNLTVESCRINILTKLKILKGYRKEIPYLKSIHLEKTNVENISEDVFTRMPNLEYLGLVNVGLKEIDEKAFQPLADSLRKLDLTNNKLTSWPKALLSLKNVESILMKDNNITHSSNSSIEFFKSMVKTLKKLKDLRI